MIAQDTEKALEDVTRELNVVSNALNHSSNLDNMEVAMMANINGHLRVQARVWKEAFSDVVRYITESAEDLGQVKAYLANNPVNLPVNASTSTKVENTVVAGDSVMTDNDNGINPDIRAKSVSVSTIGDSTREGSAAPSLCSVDSAVVMASTENSQDALVETLAALGGIDAGEHPTTSLPSTSQSPARSASREGECKDPVVEIFALNTVTSALGLSDPDRADEDAEDGMSDSTLSSVGTEKENRDEETDDDMGVDVVSLV